MSNITIDIKFLAGTEIKEAVTEAKIKAKEWNVAYVTFKFNGVSFSIGATANIEKVLEEWDSRDEKRFCIVSH